jgi:hypothetical protein
MVSPVSFCLLISSRIFDSFIISKCLLKNNQQQQLKKDALPRMLTFQEAILLMLSKNGRLNFDEELKEYFKINKRSIDEIIAVWTKSKLAYLEGDEIILLLETPVISNSPDGKIFIGENKSGQMLSWIKKRASI